MSDRNAGNIEYLDFLTSMKDGDTAKLVCLKCRIPEFQRNYVWKGSQITELISSINEHDINYYLGNIVVIKNEQDRNLIVDGQQRLITLSLISYALKEQVHDPDLVNKLSSVIWADEETLRIRFEKNNLDILYQKLLSGGFGDVDERRLDNSQVLIFNAYKKITSELKGIDDKNLFAKKILSLEFITIVTNTSEGAYELFEGLNSTGLSLSAVELTKNAILGKIKNLNPVRLNESLCIWNSIEAKFEDNDISILWFNKFLRHQWFSKFGYVSNARLFSEIKSEVIKKSVSADKLIDYLQELEKDSVMYIALRRSNINKNHFDLQMDNEAWKLVSDYVNYIEALGLDQVYSVLLALCKYGAKQNRYFKNDTFKNHVESLFRFVFIVKYTGVSPSAYETKFAKFAKDIQTLDNDYSGFKEKTVDFFDDLSGIIDSFAESFSNNVSKKVNYNDTDRGMLKMLLKNYLLFSGDGSDEDLTVEHIIPESTLRNWVLIPEMEKMEVLERVSMFGNLTLLSKKLNDEAGNLSFDDKYINSYSKSSFAKNVQLDGEWGDKFNSEDPINTAVLVRGVGMGEVIFSNYIKGLKK